MPDLHGIASYPGVLAVVSCTYTISKGGTPGVAVLTFLPQEDLPESIGDLIITDGVGIILLEDCRVENFRVTINESGIEWIIELADRRWRWREFGIISGNFNQLDPHGKLVPWTIRSPTEIALLCLAAMDEDNYFIDLPPGLTQDDGTNLVDLLQAGENFPPTNANPPMQFEADVPMLALMRVAESFGRILVWDSINDVVGIIKPGFGDDLPTDGLSIAKQSLSLKVPEIPDGVAVYGAPTKFQVRLSAEAVGQEWDESWRAIDQLSYAPVSGGAVQITQLRYGGLWGNSLVVPPLSSFPNRSNIQLYAYISVPLTKPNGESAWSDVATYNVQMTASQTIQAAAIELANKISNDKTLMAVIGNPVVTAILSGADGAIITLTGLKPGVSFTANCGYQDFAGENFFDWFKATAILKQIAAPQGASWATSGPPLFPTVKKTDRLTYLQAQALAQKYIFRCYRVTGVDISGQGPINVPGYGLTIRRQQLQILDTKVDQIVPLPGDAKILDKTGQPIVVNFYNGYSKDTPNQCFGSVSKHTQNAFFVADDPLCNTAQTDIVLTDFSVDSTFQVFTFGNLVYRLGPGGTTVEPTLTFEVGCNVLDPDTNAPIVYIARLPLNDDDVNSGEQDVNQAAGSLEGLDGYKILKKPDVQLNVTCTYNAQGIPQNIRLLEDDAVNRANYYLIGAALQYFLTDGETIEYNGIVPISLDGAIVQLTYEVGRTGGNTHASRNTEHSEYVPPYPSRRRNENLAPAVDGARNPPQPVERARAPVAKPSPKQGSSGGVNTNGGHGTNLSLL